MKTTSWYTTLAGAAEAGITTAINNLFVTDFRLYWLLVCLSVAQFVRGLVAKDFDTSTPVKTTMTAIQSELATEAKAAPPTAPVVELIKMEAGK